mgnify:FL=1
MKKIISLLVLLFSIGSFAQDKNVSATIAFPMTVGDYEDFNGIVDFGLQVRFTKLGVLNLGGSMDVNYLQNNYNLGTFSIKESALILQPRVFGELSIPSIQKFRPYFGVGYTLVNFTFKSDALKEKDNKGGLNLNLGAAFDLTDNFFVHIQYDTTKIPYKQTIENSENDLVVSYDRSLNLLKIGVGIRF